MNWKEYQREAAKLFRNLGCEAEVDKLIEGVRAKHKIDVWVTFYNYRIECKWVVECKNWKTNVPKEKVLALQKIVEDVGADRGILISKIGFQPGAIRAANQTNITLTSLEELKDYINEEINLRAIYILEVRSLKLKNKFYDLYDREYKKFKNGASCSSKLKNNIDSSMAHKIMSKVYNLELGFEAIKLAKNLFPYGFDESGNKLLFTNSIQSFVEKALDIIETAENWLKQLPEN